MKYPFKTFNNELYNLLFCIQGLESVKDFIDANPLLDKSTEQVLNLTIQNLLRGIEIPATSDSIGLESLNSILDFIRIVKDTVIRRILNLHYNYLQQLDYKAAEGVKTLKNIRAQIINRDPINKEVLLGNDDIHNLCVDKTLNFNKGFNDLLVIFNRIDAIEPTTKQIEKALFCLKHNKHKENDNNVIKEFTSYLNPSLLLGLTEQRYGKMSLIHSYQRIKDRGFVREYHGASLIGNFTITYIQQVAVIEGFEYVESSNTFLRDNQFQISSLSIRPISKQEALDSIEILLKVMRSLSKIRHFIESFKADAQIIEEDQEDQEDDPLTAAIEKINNGSIIQLSKEISNDVYNTVDMIYELTRQFNFSYCSLIKYIALSFNLDYHLRT